MLDDEGSRKATEGARMAEDTITKEDTLALLRKHKAILTQRFDVASMALFGSTVRDEASPDSDVDILVSFSGPRSPGLGFFSLQVYLEDLLGRSVDLVTEKALRPELRPYVHSEAVTV